MGEPDNMNAEQPVATVSSTVPAPDPADGGMLPITPEQATTAPGSPFSPAAASAHGTMMLNRHHFGILLGVLIAVIIGLSVLLAFLLIRGRLARDVSAEAALIDADPAPAESADPEPPTSEPVPQELAVDHALVQGIYGRFAKLREYSSALGELSKFYSDETVRTGQPGRLIMLDVIMSGMTEQKCQNTAPDNYLNICYSVAELNQRVKKAFGTEISFEPGEILENATRPLYQYDAEFGELYMLGYGIGGMGPSFVRTLLRAELLDDKLYLYEVVGERTVDGWLTKLGLDCQNHTPCGYNIGSAWQEGGGEDDAAAKATLLKYKESFDTYKWIFQKTADSDYVFAGLERVQE